MRADRRTGYLAALVAASTLLAACSSGSTPADSGASSGSATGGSAGFQQQHAGGTFKILAKSAAGTLDPKVNYTLQYWQLYQSMYDGLVAFKQVGDTESFTPLTLAHLRNVFVVETLVQIAERIAQSRARRVLDAGHKEVDDDVGAPRRYHECVCPCLAAGIDPGERARDPAPAIAIETKFERDAIAARSCSARAPAPRAFDFTIDRRKTAAMHKRQVLPVERIFVKSLETHREYASIGTDVRQL